MSWLGKNNKAIAPIRVSSSGQERNTSHTTQEKEIREYCAANGLVVEVVPIIETARDSELRKKYTKILQHALKEKIRHFIFYKTDRETRNLTDNETNEKLVRENKIVIHYVLDRKILHKHSPDSDFFMRDINAVTNKNFCRELSTKVRAATKTKAEGGWYPGTHTPLGYVHQKFKDESGRDLRRGSTIIVDGNERNVRQVKREFELRAQQFSLYDIRKKIIAEKIVPLDLAKNYHVSSIERRLKNKFYAGIFVWQDREYQGRHELFIPRDLFWAVQETFGMKNPYRKNNDGIFAGGWLKCGTFACGCNIVFDPKKKLIKETGETKMFKYYHCTNGKKVHSSMKGLNVAENIIWEDMGDAVGSISITKEFAEEISDALNEAKKKTQRAMKREISSYREALAGLESKEDEAYSDYKRGLLDDEQYRRQIKRVREERSHFTILLEQANLSINDAGWETAKSILELATNAKTLWLVQAPQQRRELLDSILSNPQLEGGTTRYELKKPFMYLAKMKDNQNWRRERDSNPR